MKILEQILQEIKSRAQELSENHWGDDERHLVGKGVQCMYVQTEQIIRSHMEDDGWILVEKQIPKWGEQALTCDKKGNIHIMTELGIPGKPFGIDENHHRYYPVIAWQTLPEPCRPKED